MPFKFLSTTNDIAKEQKQGRASIFLINPATVGGKKFDLEATLKQYPLANTAVVVQLCRFLTLQKITLKAESIVGLDLGADESGIIAVLPKSPSMFTMLKFARKLLQTVRDRKRIQAYLALPITDETYPATRIVDALVSANVAAAFNAEQYKKTPPEELAKELELYFYANSKSNELQIAAEHAEAVTQQTNLVRQLAILPANVLDCKTYVKRAQQLAKSKGLSSEWYDYKKLEKLKAGAFIAVAQGSSHRDAGILRFMYRPKASKKADTSPEVCVVGKGITFDTGGVNVKPGNSMFGMNNDMTGSAVALALVLLASEEAWPFAVDAYLAIADNAISAQAFRPNEIVYAMNGMSIETIHTDAEGRMVLADTLYLASKQQPKLIIDFATLTGSAVRAIGTNYSAGFANKPALHALISTAGELSGERCWPFPTDADYGECLESEIADTKQCRLAAGPDHIEAAVFLQKFVPEAIDYVHIDLSSAENDGGLAHVASKETGVGVRLGSQLIKLARQAKRDPQK